MGLTERGKPSVLKYESASDLLTPLFEGLLEATEW